MTLLLSLRSELLKTRRTASLYLTMIAAAIVPLIFLLNVITHGLPDEERSTRDPLNAIFKMATEMTGLGILPLFVVLICTLLPQIEYRNHTWKQLLTAPQTKGEIFAAKFLNIHLLILLFLIANHLFMWLIALATHFIIPELNLLHRPYDGGKVLSNMLQSYATVLGVSALQFWIGWRSKNFIAPVAVGLAFWLTGTLLALEYQSEAAKYFPYSFQIFVFSPSYRPLLNQAEWISTGYAVFFLVLGFLDFKIKRFHS